MGEITSSISSGGAIRNAVGSVPIVGDIMRDGNAQNIANAQGQMAQAQLSQQVADRNTALGYAKASDYELQRMADAYKTNSQDLARKQQLIDSADPALIEAGKQALSLLQGKEAATLNPIKQARSTQREALKQKLFDQLGPGYETSSAGIQALSAFDAQTDTLMTNAQQSSLSQLLGVAQQTSAQASTQTNFQNSLSLASQQGGIQQRQINAILGTNITNQGAQYVGDIMRNDASMKSIDRAQQNAAQLSSMALAAMGGGGMGTPQAQPKTGTVNG